MALEATEEDLVVQAAEAAGWIVRKIKYLHRVGCPDRLFVGFGRIVLIEFKRRGKKPVGQQKRELKALMGTGAEVYWFDNPRDALAVLGLAA